MSELKPCPNPACGSKGRISQEPKNALCDSESYARVYCTNVSCGMSRIPVSVEAWNTRPIEDALRAENKRLRRALEAIAVFGGSFNEEAARDFYLIAEESLKDGE